jgi:glycosyltransferase involved in cell wall biosynthesis
MGMNSILVSIITPAYNVADFISETIASVFNQSYTNWELIIIDDHSTDNTVAIAKEYAQKDKRVKVIQTLHNGGAPAARNLGVESAEGDLIAFLDSDDTWAENKLAIQVALMEDTNIIFSYASYHVMDENGRTIGRTVEAPDNISYSLLLKGCNVGCLTAMYNVRVLGKQYFSLVSRRGKEDYELWLKIAKACTGKQKMVGIKEPLAFYRKRSGGVSWNKKGASIEQWLVYRKVEKLNLFASVYNFILYTFNGFRKHYF